MSLVGCLHHVEIIIPRGREADARKFYCEVLGFAEIVKPTDMQKNGGLWLAVGTAQVHLSIQDGFDPHSTKAHIAYQVTNLAEIKKRLASLGIVTADAPTASGFLRTHARDPFGNRMEFLQATAE